MARRPLRKRIWFTKPQWHWFGWKTLIPYSWGGDEFMWHCWTFGWTITGRINLAMRACPGPGRCHKNIEPDELPIPVWPIDHYGHDHSKPQEAP